MTAETMDKLLITERHGAQLWVTLNRAEKANAMTCSMVDGVTAALAEATADTEIRVVVLTGAGEGVFCAGVDVREQPADGDMAAQRERRSRGLAALQDAVLDTPKPVVVVLNGTASGAGAMIALMADACVAADTAALALAEIDIGIPTFSGANILETIGGRALALDLIESGRKMPASEAHTRGLVRAVAPRGEVRAVAEGIASQLAAKDPHVFADIKPWLNRSLKASLAEARAEHARHRQQVKQ